jgi:hypothetical protein
VDHPYAQENLGNVLISGSTPISPRSRPNWGTATPQQTRKYLAAQDHNSPRRREQINAAAALVHKDESENKPTLQ